MTDPYFGIPVVVSEHIEPGVVYLFREPLFRFDDDAPLIRNDDPPKNPIIQSWLNGTLSTEDALFLALTSGDPALVFWGQHLLAARSITPENIVKITGI